MASWAGEGGKPREVALRLETASVSGLGSSTAEVVAVVVVVVVHWCTMLRQVDSSRSIAAG